MKKLVSTSISTARSTNQYANSGSKLTSSIRFFSTSQGCSNQAKNPMEFGLGKEVINKLPPYFVNFHMGISDSSSDSLATGKLKVTRGKSIISQLFATIGGLPKENEQGALVSVKIEDNYWKRKFDGQDLTSKWSIKDDLVIESFGIFSFGFKLIPIYRTDSKQLENLGNFENAPHEIVGFEHQFKKMFLFGIIPLPHMFSIDPSGKSVCVFEREQYPSNSWYVEVNITNPIIGHLCSYTGFMSTHCK